MVTALSRGGPRVEFQLMSEPSPPASPAQQQSRARNRGCGRSLEMDEITHIEFEDLELRNSIGYGTTAEVYLGSWRSRTVAIKQLLVHRRLSKQEQVAFSREINILTSVEHPNLVKLFGVTLSAPPFCIVMEYCEGGSLFDLLHNKAHVRLCLQQNVKMCTDVASAMEYLHCFQPQILHRDLKSLNLLLGNEVRQPTDVPVVKVTDFGFSKFVDQAAGASVAMTRNVGTVHWMAPEVFVTTNYTEKVDVYSYGVVVFEIIRREPPYATMDRGDIQDHVLHGERPGLQEVPEGCPAAEASLVRVAQRAWAQDPQERPTFTEILRDLRGIQLRALSMGSNDEEAQRLQAEGYVSKGLARGPHSVCSL